MASLWEIVGKRQGVKADDTEGGSPRKGDGQVGQGRSKFVTFERGSHSEFRFILVLSVMEQVLMTFGVDDTCVQEGYWTTVAEFVANLGDSAGVSRL